MGGKPSFKKVEFAPSPAVVDEDFENDPSFALYNDSTEAEQPVAPRELNTEAMSDVDLFVLQKW